MEDIMNNSEQIDNQMSNIIFDINKSRQEDTDVNEIEVIITDTETVKDTPQTQKRPTRENAGIGIDRLEPTFTVKLYDSIKKKV